MLYEFDNAPGASAKDKKLNLYWVFYFKAANKKN